MFTIFMFILVSCSGKATIDPVRPSSTAGSGTVTGDIVLTLMPDRTVNVNTIEHPYAITVRWDNGLVITNDGPTVYDFTLNADGKSYSAGIVESGMTSAPLNVPLSQGSNGFKVTFSEKPWIEINGQIIHSDGFDDSKIIITGDDRDYVSNEVLFRFDDGTADSERYRVIREHNLFLTGYNSRLGMHVGRIDDGRDPYDVVSELEKESCIKDTSVNGIMRAAFFPNDPAWNPAYPNDWRWAMERIDAQRAWDIYKDGVWNGIGDATVTNMVLCVCDTGCHPHEDFDLDPYDKWASYTYSKSFVQTNGIPYDAYGHGTSVAGIAAAQGNNGKGLSGLAWDPYILSFKCLSDWGGGSWEQIANSIHYVGEIATQFPWLKFVANYSLGGGWSEQIMQDAATFTYAVPNTLLIAAAGNSGYFGYFYPSSYAEFVSVGASTKAQYFNEETEKYEDTEVANECPGWGTNWNDDVDFCAPGTSYITTTNIPWNTMYDYPDPNCPWVCDGWYCDHFGGTSAATPHVSGLSMLLWSKYPTKTKQEIIQRIKDTCDPMHLPPEKVGLLGAGRINCYRAFTDPI